MKKRTIAILVVVGVVLFAYFAPVVHNGSRWPMNCVNCPELSPGTFMSPYYSSLTYSYLGRGAIYYQGTYYFRLWGTTFYP